VSEHGGYSLSWPESLVLFVCEMLSSSRALTRTRCGGDGVVFFPNL